ncbi:MAG: alpha/beta fold hydrolase [Betaproteobacteria bacterium]|nr:MAG: alpha/beta fold hydrolase [Betaproteobacteria bacterium]
MGPIEQSAGKPALAGEASEGGPGALLLHGLAGSPVEMHHLSRCLRQAGFTVHVPVIPGYAFGTRADPFDTGAWEQWVAYASGALDTLSQRHGRIYVAGLCIGAVLALRLAMVRPERIRAMSLISTTLHHDGWATPWYRKVVRLAGHTPLRRHVKLHERFPYGLKNERLRQRVARAMHTEGSSAAGAEFLPLSGMHQSYRLSWAVRRDIGLVTTPSLVLHALDDDVASTRSAEFVARNIDTREVRTVLYRESYHILTMDNDKDAVADETIGFFQRHGAQGSSRQQRRSRSERQSALPPDALPPDINTWMPGFGPEPATDDARKEPLDLELPSGVAQL